MNVKAKLSKTVSRRRSRPQSGFTLIELVISIAIISILANVAIVMAGQLMSKARDARRRSDLKALSVAVNQYYADRGTYTMPGLGANGDGYAGNINQGYGQSTSGFVPYPGVPITVYLKQLGYLQQAPVCDPSDRPPCYQTLTKNYYYVACPDGTYSLSGTLENPKPSDLAHTPYVCGASLGTQPLSSGGVWNPIDSNIKRKNFAVP